jgi:hypothetical protein
LHSRASLQDEEWIEVAAFAAYGCQIESLSLKPWESPPCVEGEDDPNPHDKDAQKLLRQMLAAKISRYEPHPLEALRRAKRKRRIPPVKAALRGKQ